MSEDGRAALTIVGGFLGAGKTTWLRHQLRSGAMGAAEVFVNEAAETPVDDLLLACGARVTVLAGGCVCCAGRADLIAALRDWCDRKPPGPPPRLVLETSGLADPAPIVAAIRGDAILVHHLHVDAVIVLADAANILAQLAVEPLGWRQVEAADRIVLTKAGGLLPPDIGALVATLGRINPGAAVNVAETGVEQPLPPAAAPLPLPSRPEVEAEPLVATDLDIAPGTDPTTVLVWLSALLAARGEDLVRVKGTISTPAGRLLLQGVRRSVQQPQILPGGETPAPDRIVVIGRGASREALLQSFHAFCDPAGDDVGGGDESSKISAPQASKKHLRCQAAIGGIVYTEGVSRPCASLIFANSIRPLSGNHSALFAPSERISRTAASNSSIAFSAATSFIATIRS